jgi:hypothetical protein
MRRSRPIPALNPLLLEKGIRSLAGVPLLVHGAVLGVLHVGTVRDRVFTSDDAALLQMAALSDASSPGTTSPFWYCAGCARRRTGRMLPRCEAGELG